MPVPHLVEKVDAFGAREESAALIVCTSASPHRCEITNLLGAEEWETNGERKDVTS
jgi:hypothetical protein